MRIVLLLSCFFCSPFAFAQQAKQYAFKHFTVNNGLASNSVNDVVQDRDGYMWLATTNGLQRYDGNDFLTFKGRQNDPGAIPNTSLARLYSDGKGRLWVMSDNNHLGVFDTKRFTYRQASLPRDETVFLVQHFVQLQTGELLLIRRGRSVLQYDEARNSFRPVHGLFPLPAGWQVDEIFWDRLQRGYWISCDSGLVQYNPATRHVNYRGHNVDADPVIAAFAARANPVNVRADAQGNVFFYYWEVQSPMPYICRYNRRLKKAEETFLNIGYHEIMDFLLQRNGRVWIYGAPFFAEWTRNDSGFVFLTNEYLDEQSLKFDHAQSACEDREGNVWIATDNGAYLFNADAQIFNSYRLVRPGEEAQDAPVNAVTQLPDGRIFIGCWGRGLFCFDRHFNPLPVPAPFQPRHRYMSVWDMTVHSRTGKLWITQQGGVVDVYDPKTGQLVTLQPDIFKHSTIRQVDEDTSGNLWFGTQNGTLLKWDPVKAKGNPAEGYEVVFRTARIQKVHFDYQGYIWLATLGNGLVKLDAKTGKVVHSFTTKGPPGEQLYSDAPDDITYYDDTTLLVAARCLHIINTRTNKVTLFTAEDGLPSNTIQSLQRDKSGIVWMGMADGMCRLNMNKKVISYFDRRDGISYDKFAPAGVQQMDNGLMIFYTDHNFLAFDPRRIAGQNLPPRPFITSFKLAGKPLSLDSLQRDRSIILQYNNTSIGINFSALSYLPQRKVHYFYMLEGLDKEWIHTDHPVEAIYNYLPPGEYTFRVKSETVDGLTSAIASVPITVRSPFWDTWWFYSLCALLAIAILYLLDRERMNKHRSLQQMRNQIRQNLRDEVSTTLNNINVLSEIAKIKADKNVAQSKDFISQISDKSRYMIEAMDDMLWSIDPQNDSMKKTVLRIKEATEAFRASHDIGIDLIVDRKVQELQLDMKLRYELFFFYKEALNFIVQHINCHQVFVNFNKVRARLMMEILCECNEAGEGARSKFLQALDKRIRLLPATIEVIADSKSFALVLYIEVK